MVAGSVVHLPVPLGWCALEEAAPRITGPIGSISSAMDALYYEMAVTGIQRMPS